MDALVTAGGIPEPGEPLYAETQGGPKALLDIAGKPMVQWVLDALGDSQRVERVVVVGLERDCGVHCRKPTDFVPNSGGLLANLERGLRRVMALNPQAEYALVVSGDIPAIRGAMVDWTVDTATQTRHDLYYCVIERRRMEERFPGSRRSYVRLKDHEVCGGDMNVLRLGLAAERGFWDKLVAARKNAMKQAALVGFDVFLLALTRQLTLARAEAMISRRLKLRGRVLLCPYPEVGMDVDKPHQLDLLRQDLAARWVVAG